MKHVVILTFLLLTSFAQAAEHRIGVVGAEFWVLPRHGEVVLKHEPIASAVRLLIADPEAYLVLHYPDTESGELWGQELQAWLVSLGIVSDRLELRSGFDGEGVALIVVGSDSDPLVLEMMPIDIDDYPAGNAETIEVESIPEAQGETKTEQDDEVAPESGVVTEVPSQDEVE